MEFRLNIEQLINMRERGSKSDMANYNVVRKIDHRLNGQFKNFLLIVILLLIKRLGLVWFGLVFYDRF